MNAFNNNTAGQVYAFRKAYIEHKITFEVEQYGDHQMHREVLKIATQRFKEQMSHLMPEVEVFATGSFACGVDTHSSDLDFTLKFRNEEDGKMKPIEKLAALRKMIWDKRTFYKSVKLINGRVPLLKIQDIKMKVEIDVTCDNDTAKRNTAILHWYGQVDSRFAVLCRAVKDWAHHSGVENSKEGRINSFSICLMLINYLQVGVSPPVLPCLHKELPELNGEIQLENDDFESWRILEKLEQIGVKIGENKSSLGELFAGFIQYYANFDFKTKWISVRRGKVMEKLDENGNLMEECPKTSEFLTIEDPFLLNPWNCAGTMFSQIVYDRFLKEFGDFSIQINKLATIYVDRQSPLARERIMEGKKRDMLIQVEKDKKWEETKDDEWIVNEESCFSHVSFYSQHPEVYWDTWMDKKKIEMRRKLTEKRKKWIVPLRSLLDGKWVEWSISTEDVE